MATLSEKILSKSIILKRIRSQSLLRASIHSGFQTLAGHTSFPSCRLWFKTFATFDAKRILFSLPDHNSLGHMACLGQ